MKRCVMLALLLLSTPWARADTPEELFGRGNTAYEESRYADASGAYRGVIRYGIQDPIVEYNLANAEFRLGRLGQAILHYERARRLKPNDRDIRNNLAYAREFCADRVEVPEEAAVVRWVRSVQDRIGPDLQAWAGVAIFWVLAGLVAWSLGRPEGWRAATGWTVAGLCLVLILVAASSYRTAQRLDGQTLAVVLQPAVEVLAGPGSNNAALFTVHEGLTLEVRAEREDWIQVGLPNGLNGWIARTAIEIV